MPKFAIGDVVEKDKSNPGVVAAVFTANSGELRYVVEHEGELQFILESELVPHQTHH
jgi:hypothetical protein